MVKHLKKDITTIIKLLRAKQWIKNSFIFAALIFSRKFSEFNSFILCFIAFLCFSMISSAVYLLNDIIDVEEDKKHPKKMNRPIASGKISIKFAIVLMMILIISSLLISSLLNIKLTEILIVYFIINVFYCTILKRIVIIDVMVIASGFILRVISGAVVINVPISKWIIICTGLLSLYLGFGKRKNEIMVLKNDAGLHRKILSQYSVEYLDKITIVLLGLVNMTYILYIIEATQYSNLIFTIPFVIYGTLRYELLITSKEFGGSPEDTFTDDKAFLINISLWLIVSIVSIYV